MTYIDVHISNVNNIGKISLVFNSSLEKNGYSKVCFDRNLFNK